MGQKHPFMAQSESMVAEAARAAGRAIPPPYHTYDVDIIYLYCRFDLAMARKVLPPPLEPVDEGSGIIMFINARRGWVIAPFTGFVATLHVKGFDGPDNYPAGYIHTAFYTGVCGQVFRQVFNDRLTDGFAKAWVDGDRIRGAAGRDGEDTAMFSARRLGNPTEERVGVNHYLTSLGNTIRLQSTNYSCRYEEMDEVSLEILDTAPEPLRRLKPLEVAWQWWLEGMQVTFNPARVIGTDAETVSADTALASMFDLVSRFKRPAAILSSSGRPLFITREAEEMLGAGQLQALAGPKLVGGALRGGRLSEPFVIEHGSGRPLLAQVIPIIALSESEPLRLVLFTDPKGVGRGDPEPVLQLLGLTPSEARLAVAVGRGTPPKDAASALRVTVSTAQSMMKGIFAKLEVQRQAQLAQLVTRLETV